MPGGRPRKDDKRDRVVSIRLTQLEFTALEKTSLAYGQTVSEYIRRVGLGDIEIDSKPDAETDDTDIFADYAKQVFERLNPPAPIMGVFQAATAQRVADFHGPFIGTRLQLWATAGGVVVMLVYKMDDGGAVAVEAWRPFRESFISESALLDALRAYLTPEP